MGCGLKMKSLNIMGVHSGEWVEGGGVHKKYIYIGGDCLKKGSLDGLQI